MRATLAASQATVKKLVGVFGHPQQPGKCRRYGLVNDFACSVPCGECWAISLAKHPTTALDAAIAEAVRPWKYFFDGIALYFKSGNSVSVEKATIPLDEFERLAEMLRPSTQPKDK